MRALRIVPDASVAAKWLLPEEGSDVARLLLETAVSGDVRFSVPEQWFVEIGSVLWKRTRRGELERAAGFAMLERLTALPVRIHGHRALVAPAYEIAATTGVTVYDALYVVLAIRDRGVFVTADERLARRLSASQVSGRISLLRDVAAVLGS